MAKVTVNGVKLHYLQQGEGADVVLLHGLTGDLSAWLFTVLPKLAERFRVTVYDLRGHGLSDAPSSGYTAVDLAEELHGLLDVLQIEKAHFLGHSFGGTIILQHAALYPQRARSLVVCESSLGISTQLEVYEDWLRETLLYVAKNYGVELPPDVDLRYIGRYWRLLESIPLEFGLRKNMPRRMGRLKRLFEGTTVIEDSVDVSGLTDEALARVTVPTLELYASDSPFLRTRGYLERVLPDCRVTLVDDMDHFTLISFPDSCLGPVIQHFEDTDLRQSRLARVG